MSRLALNQNQTFQTPMLGQVTRDPQPGTFPVQIDPSSTWAYLAAGTVLKLVAKAGPNIVVDAATSASDGPVFGVIPYVMKKNVYAAGDSCPCVGVGGVLMLKSGGAINRNDLVAGTNSNVATSDPTVATDTTTNDYIIGKALGQAAGAGVLLAVIVQPGKITSTGVVSQT